MPNDTIFALATPYAKSGVAIIRLSGSQARPALARLSGTNDWTPNTARYCTFLRTADHVPQTTIDHGIALFFQAPHSFTGEDVAELHIHGSLAVIREMLEVLGGMEWLRHAEPGEFSRRAFMNGKMDLIEAEGLADLIAAETQAQKTQALTQMGGALSGFYEELRMGIVRCLALLEATIDFPDEEIPETVLMELSQNIEALKDSIESALKDTSGERVREGIRIVILGAPNAGKSSLLNTLSGRDAAIVSHKAGTTRDVIEVHMDIDGFPVILTDTAGLRESGDDIEEEGVRRALDRAGKADIKLLILDGAETGESKNLISGLSDNSTIHIISKSDIRKIQKQDVSLAQSINISSKTGDGISELLEEIKARIASSFSSESAPVITRDRHRSLLTETLENLTRFSLETPLEISCEELRRAGVAVGKITGRISVDDVLDVVFKQFCIGK